MRNIKRNEHAVSETVGFVIIFGIMLTGIALVTLYGYPAVLDAQQNANIRNMERNMISLQSDVKSLAYKNVPYKETTMQVSGGVLKVENPDTEQYRFEIYDQNGPLISYADLAYPDTFPPGSIKFLSDSEDISIALQNGAVVKHQSDGSVMLSEPRWFFDDPTDTLVINLIQIYSSQPLAKSGITTIQMRIDPLNIDPADGDNIVDTPPAGDVTIEYYDGQGFEFITAWNNYFGSTGYPPTKTFTCSRVIIKAWRITVLNI